MKRLFIQTLTPSFFIRILHIKFGFDWSTGSSEFFKGLYHIWSSRTCDLNHLYNGSPALRMLCVKFDIGWSSGFNNDDNDSVDNDGHQSMVYYKLTGLLAFGIGELK